MSDPCYYCGLTATSIDHVVSQKILNGAMRSGDIDSLIELYGHGRTMTVPACQQCNSILGATYDRTLADRKTRLKLRLRKKLANDLSMPDWSEAQQRELSPRLQQYVLQGLERRRIAQERIRW